MYFREIQFLQHIDEEQVVSRISINHCYRRKLLIVLCVVTTIYVQILKSILISRISEIFSEALYGSVPTECLLDLIKIFV